MRKTCAGCEYLYPVRMPYMSGLFMSCKKTGLVVPHRSCRSENGDHWDITLWRVPLECPLPEVEALKSAEKAPQKYWDKITLSL